jgi:hypothetical protein
LIRIAGLWELGWNTPIKEADLWEFPLREFGVDRWFMSPVSGIVQPLVTEVPDLQPLIAEHRAAGFVIVYVDEKGSTPLSQLTHPTDALYVCGRTSLSSLVAYGQSGDLSTRIETPLGHGMLWAHQAATIVLYDRLVKSWR